MSLLQGGRNVKGSVAIITGASRGIGRAIALKFAQHGINVVLCAKSETETPNLPGTIYSVAKECEKFGVVALPLKVDVRNDEDIDNAIRETISKFGRIDFMINNAGALFWKDVIDTPMKRYDLINGINSRASFAFTSKVLPYMLKQRNGSIINCSPPIKLEGLKGYVGYSISKFGMTLLAHGLAEEVKGTGVNINALWPATIVESQASINHNIGDRSSWRTSEMLADCALMIVSENPNKLNGEALIDEDYMVSRGITDFKKYRCDPNVEPPRIISKSSPLFTTSKL